MQDTDYNFKVTEKTKYWDSKKLDKILKNQTYTGDLIQSKKRTISHKIHKVVENSFEDWIIIPNHHEAIISREDFNQVQDIIYDRDIKVNKNKEYDTFSGHLRCNDCGNSFTIKKIKKYEYYYCTSFLREKSCTNHSIKKEKLKEMVLNDVSGDWGVDDTIEDPDLISCLTIRGTEFDNKFNLDLDNNRTKFRKYSKASFDKIALKEKDILIEKSGGSEDQPVGRVAFIEKDMLDKYSLAFSNFIHRIRIDENKAVPEYVFEYLRLMHNIKITEVMQTQTNGIRNLIMQEYFGQTILLPEPKKQEEIAIHAAQMRKRAFELQEEAEKIVLDAKAKVEKMLLGDEQ